MKESASKQTLWVFSLLKAFDLYLVSLCCWCHVADKGKCSAGPQIRTNSCDHCENLNFFIFSLHFEHTVSELLH